MAEYYDEIFMRNLKVSNTIKDSDFITGETETGTKLFPVSAMRNMFYSMQVFEDVNKLKNTKLNEGDIVYTKGYRYFGDGGGAVYIVSYDPTAIEDKGLVHNINTDNTLKLKLLMTNNEVNVHHFGAYGDGIHDDTKAIQNAINTGNTVNFTSGKLYKITSSIKITKSNQIININNSTIIPHNCAAFLIEGEEESYVQDIVFNNIHIRCNNNGRGMDILKFTKNIIIDGFSINGISSNNYAFDVDSCERLTIVNGVVNHVDYNGYTFSLKSTDSENKNRYIFLKNIQSFNADTFAIIQFSDETTRVVVENSSLINNDLSVDNLSRAFYVYGNCDHLNIVNFSSTNVDTFLYTSSDASCNINVSDLTVFDNRNIYCLNSMVSKNHVYLSGLHRYTGVAKDPKNVIVSSMLSNLHIDTDVSYDEYSYDVIGETATLTGKLFDKHIVELIEEKQYALKTSTTLRVDAITNARYDWVGDLVLKNIDGFEGQMIYVRSTTSQEISSGGNIILYPDEPDKSFKEPMQSSPYKFKCVGNKWIKID